MFTYLEKAREARVGRLRRPEDLRLELLEAAALCGLARMELSAPWAEQVICSDTCPGGHGLAYAAVPI
eukprot:11172026-Lingulodinium_polyedra.AAC.1